MKTKVMHTPTPWKVDKNGPRNNIRDSEDCIIAHANTYYKEFESNAAFIVRSVNSHEELLDKLKKMVKVFTSGNSSQHEVRLLAIEAIAKAEVK